MSGGEKKNDNDNREYKYAYDTARDGGDGSYTFTRFSPVKPAQKQLAERQERATAVLMALESK